jgi:hypothetical protein
MPYTGGFNKTTAGKSARVETRIRLRGKWQPPGTEVWTLVEGKWCYQRTVKS